MGLEEDISNLRLDIAELKGFADSAQRPKVKDSLSIESRRLETKLVELLKLQESQKTAAQSTAAAASSSQTNAKAYDYVLKTYSWDQSDKFVKIYLTDLKNVESLKDRENDFEFKTDTKSVRFVAKNLDGKNCIFELKELAGKITPEKSEFKVKSDMVVLMLKKYETEKWSHLKMSDKQSTDKKMKMPATDKDADPSASLMSLMKQMYEDGDDDMKRTIAKAWSESRNTTPEL